MPLDKMNGSMIVDTDGQSFSSKLGSLSTSVTTNTTNLGNLTNQGSRVYYPAYKGMSLYLYPGITSTLISFALTNMVSLGFNAVNIVVRHSVSGSTVTALMDDTTVQTAITTAKNNGLTVNAINCYIDGSSLQPADIATFFTNWQTSVLHYASLCNSNSIIYLGIANEMYNLTNDYLTNWNTLISAVKATGVKIGANFAGFNEYDKCVFTPQLDSIGINYYPQMTGTPGDLSVTQAKANGYVYYTYDGQFAFEKFSRIRAKYPTKKLHMSETGCMNTINGFYAPADSTQTTSSDIPQQITYEAILSVYGQTPNLLDGIFFWEASDHSGYNPWRVYGSTSAQPPVQDVIKKYVVGVN
jgi:hypothetical protein